MVQPCCKDVFGMWSKVDLHFHTYSKLPCTVQQFAMGGLPSTLPYVLLYMIVPSTEPTQQRAILWYTNKFIHFLQLYVCNQKIDFTHRTQDYWVTTAVAMLTIYCYATTLMVSAIIMYQQRVTFVTTLEVRIKVENLF